MIKFVKYQTKDGLTHFGLINKESNFIEIEGDIFTSYKVTDKIINPEEVRILPPVIPSKIVAVGLNYKDHAKELGMKLPDEPIIFIKTPNTVIGHMDKIIYPEMSKQIDYEAELAIIIKNTIKNIEEDLVDANILGYTCLNDITARDLQKKDGQWTRAKCFDTFAPIGPYFTKDINPDKVAIKLYLNNELKQNSNTSNFIFKTKKLVNFISKIMTLNRGDIITTGTPAGIGPIKKGDKVEVEIEGIGKLTNFVE
jgi:2-keto-4-pentenoate hydratase/2-oxohepta-3-ene-1,7-dioic acid hydratase in catechol pathway